MGPNNTKTALNPASGSAVVRTVKVGAGSPEEVGPEHDGDELPVPHLTITITICFRYHVIDLCLGQILIWQGSRNIIFEKVMIYKVQKCDQDVYLIVYRVF